MPEANVGWAASGSLSQAEAGTTTTVRWSGAGNFNRNAPGESFALIGVLRVPERRLQCQLAMSKAAGLHVKTETARGGRTRHRGDAQEVSADDPPPGLLHGIRLDVIVVEASEAAAEAGRIAPERAAELAGGGLLGVRAASAARLIDRAHVVADSLLAALDHGRSLRDDDALRPWLLRIATNKALRHRQRAAHAVELEVVEGTAAAHRGPTAADPVPRSKGGYAQLKVAAATRALTVAATPDRPQAKPGETVHYDISVRDRDGHGVRSEISVAVVDKAVLALADERGPDGMHAFWFERGLAVSTASSLSVSMDRANDVIADAGRGGKGQTARSGGSTRPGFEGGQMPLIRRIPKRGFTNPFKTPAQVVNVRHLGLLKAGRDVTPETLFGAGLVRRPDRPIKLLGTGEVTERYAVRGVQVSASARTSCLASANTCIASSHRSVRSRIWASS